VSEFRGDELLSIGEIAERCGVATSAVRYYEGRGLIRSTRTSGNQRRFARETIRRIAFITAAQAVGRSLDEIAESLGSLPEGRTPTTTDWEEFARGWRPRLDEQIARLTDLRDKLDACIGCGCLSLKSCALYNPLDEKSAEGPGPRNLTRLSG
jgi:MerR family redox-sensitive transcriptional activator SoxR